MSDEETYLRQMLHQLRMEYEKASEPYWQQLYKLKAMEMPTVMINLSDLPEQTRRMLEGKAGEILPVGREPLV